MARNLLQTGNNPQTTEVEALFKIADDTGNRSARAVAKLALKMVNFRARRARKLAKASRK